MPYRGRTLPSVLGVALAVALAACGGSSNGPTVVATPTPTPPPPPAPEVVEEVRGFSLEPLVLGVLEFTTERPGTLEVTVDWTFEENDVDVYVAQGECTFDQFVNMECEVPGFSESATAKPEVVEVASLPAGTHTLFVGNRGPRGDTLSLQIVLTPDASAASSSRPGRPYRVDAGFERWVTMK